MLEHWRGLDPNQKLTPAPVPYKHTGTTYAQDGLRITGAPQWIDAVLSRLQDLLDFENGQTRLQVVYKESRDRETGAELESSNCYVQVHERGGQAIMCNAFLNTYAAAQGANIFNGSERAQPPTESNQKQ